ncbi:MAG: ArdC family protein [Dehalococcoidia bacterium]
MTTVARHHRGRPLKERPDPYAEVTSRITAALEAGTVPWRHPWRARGHRNAISHRPYRGINLLLLGLLALQQGYTDPRWLTYRQAASLGGHVRRGERGTSIVLWKPIERRDAADGEVIDTFTVMRFYTVFNASQCDGVELPEVEAATEFDPIERAEAVIAGYAGGPPVLHDAQAAYYVPSKDEVHLPPRTAFRDADGYYATLFHELAHSTGHPSRLNREGYQTAAVFGSPSYGREELVAEFGAAFLSQEAGIDASRLDQSAAYIASWLVALRNDRRLAVTAAGLAQRATDRILGRELDADTRRDHNEVEDVHDN